MARLIVAAAGLGLAAWWLLNRQAGAVAYAEGELPQDSGADAFDLPNVFTNITDMMNPTTDQDQAAANEAAFLLMIRTAEGTADANGYRRLFGGDLFTGWDDHPRQVRRYRGLWTSAAGAYQFMAISPIPGTDKSTKVNTWDRIAARLGLTDFTPASQDAGALELIREAGALGDVRAGRFDQAVAKVRGIWASLPGAGYGQPERSLQSLRTAYLNAGGALA